MSKNYRKTRIFLLIGGVTALAALFFSFFLRVRMVGWTM